MLGSAEPPRRIQIGFPSSETKKRKKKKFLYLNSYFPLQPVPTLLDSTVPYLDNVLMSCTTWSKIAQLGSYPGIIKCPWVLASTLHNWREEREVGGGGVKIKVTMYSAVILLQSGWRVSPLQSEGTTCREATEREGGDWREEWYVRVEGAIALLTTHVDLRDDNTQQVCASSFAYRRGFLKHFFSPLHRCTHLLRLWYSTEYTEKLPKSQSGLGPPLGLLGIYSEKVRENLLQGWATFIQMLLP